MRISRCGPNGAQPILSWHGRSCCDLEVDAVWPPLREIWGREDSRGKLVLGDNLGVLAGLEPGSVRLVYMDPPFFSQRRYTYRVRTGEEWFTLPSFEDTWQGDLAAYLSFLEDRFLFISRALADDGSLYVHVDSSAGHYVKVLLDQIFGPETFCRQIVWKIGWVSGFKSKVNNWIRNHDIILYYARRGAPFKRKLLPHPEGYFRRSGKAGLGRPIDDVWIDIPSIQLMSFSSEKTGWATQKNEELLRRIIEASSEPGDVVLDPFAGAGTTAVVAASSDRRFITIDQSPLSVHLSRRRLIASSCGFEVYREDSGAAHQAEAIAFRRPEGVQVRLTCVPDAAGPTKVGWRSRIDSWWICRSSSEDVPIWSTHRAFSRNSSPVELDSPFLKDVSTRDSLIITAVDLAGCEHKCLVEQAG